jgi:hypothetical protein
MSIWPVHCSRHLSRCGVLSCSTRSQVEFVVRLIGLNVCPQCFQYLPRNSEKPFSLSYYLFADLI